MVRGVLLFAGVVFVLGTGIVHGLWTDRWHLSNEPRASADKLDYVPAVVGDWEGKNREQLDAQTLVIGEIAGYLVRPFKNRRTGQEVRVLCVCGRPGPIGQHPPEVCFGGAGYELMKKEKEAIAIEGSSPAQFWIGKFRNVEAGVPSFIRIYWAWSPNGTWTAPDSPRFTFAKYPALYKIYIIHQMSRDDEPPAEDPSPDFIKVLLPELQKVLFTPSSSEPTKR